MATGTALEFFYEIGCAPSSSLVRRSLLASWVARGRLH
jgi:hypothetical protein